MTLEDVCPLASPHMEQSKSAEQPRRQEAGPGEEGDPRLSKQSNILKIFSQFYLYREHLCRGSGLSPGKEGGKTPGAVQGI